jgi:hypothetical protein
VATSSTIGFDAAQHGINGLGWVLSYDNGTGTIVSTNYDTLTLAATAQKNMFSADPTIQGVLSNQAASSFIAVPANATTIGINTGTLRTGEGLNSAYP